MSLFLYFKLKRVCWLKLYSLFEVETIELFLFLVIRKGRENVVSHSKLLKLLFRKRLQLVLNINGLIVRMLYRSLDLVNFFSVIYGIPIFERGTISLSISYSFIAATCSSPLYWKKVYFNACIKLKSCRFMKKSYSLKTSLMNNKNCILL